MNNTVWILKVPTQYDIQFIAPIEVLNDEYTIFDENDSMYGGYYPLTSRIICYTPIDYSNEIIVPYTFMGPDYRYGFYEFNNLEEMKYWINKNQSKTKELYENSPEFLI